ncbi:MAG: hypothetical protein EXR69_00225 [Myxococcales bacterium]|nr:hypothetical protein [Myxococcales bacterium]
MLALAAALGAGERMRAPAGGALVVGGVLQAWFTFTLPVARDFAASLGDPIGRFLELNLQPGALVATASAGATAFRAPSINFLHSLGLNDKHIASRRVGAILTRGQHMPGHQKGGGAYVLRREPDLVILGPTEGYLGTDPTLWILTE